MNCPYLQMNTNVYIFSKYITIYKSNSELQTFYFSRKPLSFQTIYISNQRKSKRSQSIPRALATPLP